MSRTSHDSISVPPRHSWSTVCPRQRGNRFLFLPGLGIVFHFRTRSCSFHLHVANYFSFTDSEYVICNDVSFLYCHHLLLHGLSVLTLQVIGGNCGNGYKGRLQSWNLPALELDQSPIPSTPCLDLGYAFIAQLATLGSSCSLLSFLSSNGSAVPYQSGSICSLLAVGTWMGFTDIGPGDSRL